MANRYWVGGTNTWNSTLTGKWATTSGGASGASVPTAADDVFFDANDGAAGAAVVTLNAASVCRSLNCTGFTGTISHPISTPLFIGDATAGASNIILKFVAGMTYTIGSTTTSKLAFQSTSATTQTVDYGGKTTSSVDYLSGVCQLVGAHTANVASTVQLAGGTLDTNGQTGSWGFFSANNSTTRSLILGSSSITLTGGSGTHWNISTITGLTFNAGTSTITLSYTSTCTFAGGGLTYNNLVINYVMGIGTTYSGNNTFNNVTINTTSGTNTNQAAPTLSGNMTVTGLLTVAGLSAIVRPGIVSNTPGTARTITVSSAPVLSNTDFMDITFAGAGVGAGVTGTSLGDAGGNSGIIFTSLVTRYWVGGTGNTSDTTHWSASSGGAGGASVPLPHDDWFANASSGGGTITSNMFYVGRNIDFSGFTGTLAGSTTRNVFGSHTFGSAMTVGGTSPVNLRGRGSHTITSNGKSFPANLTLTNPGGTYSLGDDIAMGAAITLGLSIGTLDANNKNVTAGLLSSGNTNTRAIIMGSGTWTLSGVGNVWNTGTVTGLTLTPNTATIAITDVSASSKTITPANGITMPNVSITPGGTGAVILQGSTGVYNDIVCNGGPKTITFSPSAKTILGQFALKGSAGNLVTLNTSTPGTPATFTKTAGIVNCDYLSIQDIAATGGAQWFAGPNSTNVSGNSGWIFTAAQYALAKSMQYAIRIPRGNYRKIPQLVQEIIYSDTGVSSFLIPVTGVQAGNSLIVTVVAPNSTSFNGVNDNGSRKYTKQYVVNDATTGTEHYWYSTTQVAVGGSINVTGSFGASVAGLFVIIREVANIQAGDPAITAGNNDFSIIVNSNSDTNSGSPSTTPSVVVGVVDGSIALFVPSNPNSANYLSGNQENFTLANNVSTWRAAVTDKMYQTPINAPSVTGSFVQASSVNYLLTAVSYLGAIDTSRTPIQKSVQYTILRSAAISKSQTYRILRSSVISKSSRYTIRLARLLSKTTQYSITRSPSLSKSQTYRIKRTFTVAKSSRYAINQSKSLAKAMKYALRANHSISLAMRYSFPLPSVPALGRPTILRTRSDVTTVRPSGDVTPLR